MPCYERSVAIGDCVDIRNLLNVIVMSAAFLLGTSLLTRGVYAMIIRKSLDSPQSSRSFWSIIVTLIVSGTMMMLIPIWIPFDALRSFFPSS